MSITLITGAGGFIARHMALELKDSGIEAIGLDNCVNCSDPTEFYKALGFEFYRGSIGDTTVLETIFAKHRIDAVIHFAGRIYVGESFELPHTYYQANTSDALTFFNFALEHGTRNIVFSSSAGVYGVAERIPIGEDHPTVPINPYGRSKLATEWIIKDLCALHADSRFAILRYFNVAGADAKGRSGQSSPRANHLIEVACEAALGLRPGMSVFGTDYPTADGTCIRDYVHVGDLAAAHRHTLEYLRKGGESVTMNCGYGHGYSVQEIVDMVKKISGRNFPVEYGPRRAGDPPELVAGNAKILGTLPWRPQHDDVEFIVRTAYEWKRTNLEASGNKVKVA